MRTTYKIVKKASTRYNNQNAHVEIVKGKLFICMGATVHKEAYVKIDPRDVDMEAVIAGTIPSNWLSRIFQNAKNEVRYFFGTEENQTIIYFEDGCYLVDREVNDLVRDVMDGLLYVQYNPNIMYLSGYGLETTLNDVFNPVGINTEANCSVRELSSTVAGTLHLNEKALEFSKLGISDEDLVKVMTTRKNTTKIVRHFKDWYVLYRAGNRKVYVYTLTDALNLLSIKK